MSAPAEVCAHPTRGLPRSLRGALEGSGDEAELVSPGEIAATSAGATRILAFVTGALLVAHVLGQVLVLAGVESRYLLALIRRFDLDDEANIPTFYNALLLLVGSALFLVAAAGSGGRQVRWEPYWRGMAALFAFLAIDEAVELHGFFSEIGRVLDLDGVLKFSWVGVYGPLVLVLAWVYRPFCRHLPPATRRDLILAAVVYVGGALGVEMVGGAHSTTHGESGVGYRAITTTEELLEMGGLVLLIRGLLRHTRLRILYGGPAAMIQPTS